MEMSFEAVYDKVATGLKACEEFLLQERFVKHKFTVFTREQLQGNIEFIKIQSDANAKKLLVVVKLEKPKKTYFMFCTSDDIAVLTGLIAKVAKTQKDVVIGVEPEGKVHSRAKGAKASKGGGIIDKSLYCITCDKYDGVCTECFKGESCSACLAKPSRHFDFCQVCNVSLSRPSGKVHSAGKAPVNSSNIADAYETTSPSSSNVAKGTKSIRGRSRSPSSERSRSRSPSPVIKKGAKGKVSKGKVAKGTKSTPMGNANLSDHLNEIRCPSDHRYGKMCPGCFTTNPSDYAVCQKCDYNLNEQHYHPLVCPCGNSKQFANDSTCSKGKACPECEISGLSCNAASCGSCGYIFRKTDRQSDDEAPVAVTCIRCHTINDSDVTRCKNCAFKFYMCDLCGDYKHADTMVCTACTTDD